MIFSVYGNLKGENHFINVLQYTHKKQACLHKCDLNVVFVHIPRRRCLNTPDNSLGFILNIRQFISMSGILTLVGWGE